MLSKLYIIPGLGESTRMKNYRSIISFAKKIKIEVIPIKVTWSQKLTITDFIKEVDKQIPDNSENDYILGFSIGAYILSILSSKKKVRGYIFCTISPFFKEYIDMVPKETKEYFGKKMLQDFSTYSLPKGNTLKAWFFVGEKEWELAKEVAKKAYMQWKGEKELIIVEGAGHELGNVNYSREVQTILNLL